MSKKKRSVPTESLSEFVDRVSPDVAGVQDRLGHVHGASTLLNADGHVIHQWLKQTKVRSAADVIAEVRAALKSKPLPARKSYSITGARLDRDLLSVYPMGDPHIGMLSWRNETGADFDLRIAERLLFDAVDALVDLSPPSHQALIINVGDYFHADSNASTTTKGTKVDVDSRWAKVFRVGVALQVHEVAVGEPFVGVPGVPRRGPVTPAVIWRAQMRAALDHLARDFDVGKIGIGARVVPAAARIFRDAGRLLHIGFGVRTGAASP
jgi:hypothetical protein